MSEFSTEEIRQLNIDLRNHSKTIKQDIKIEKKKDTKTNLFCIHRETIEKDGYIVCVKCNAKWKVK